MAVVYRSTLRTARMNLVKDDIDSGSGAGTLEICSASYAAVLATLTLSDPCGSVSGDTLTFSAITQDSSADATGTAAVARIKNSSGTVIVQDLTVGTSGSNINLNTTSIVAGDIVQITSATLTHAT